MIERRMNKKMNEELKTCPFCGSKNIRLWGEKDKGTPWVQCNNCLASTGTYEKREQAIGAWNRRV